MLKPSVVVLLVLGAVACGGSDSKEDQALAAKFRAASTATVGTAVSFDGSASTGSVSAYVWDFGNGHRATGKSIAQVFSAAGSFDITLTVSDATGATSNVTRSISVTDRGAVAATTTARGFVTDLSGVALSEVEVTPVGGAFAKTDASGQVTVTLDVGRDAVVRLHKTGFADQLAVISLPVSIGSDAFFNATMHPRDAAQTLDAAAGGSLTGRDGARITLPAGALIDPTNTAFTGTANIAMTAVDVTRPGAAGFPGKFTGLNGDASTTPIASFGATEYALQSAPSNARLQLAAGKRADIELPLYATADLSGSLITIGQTLPLWSLDEMTGIWINEGDGTVVASADAPNGMTLKASVAHFSWWNADANFPPWDGKPRCVPDAVQGAEDFLARASICNMVTDIDRGSAGTLALRPATAVRLPGYAATASIPLNGGGSSFPVPADTDLIFSGAALNGTWAGSTRVHSGAANASGDVVIILRPLDPTIGSEAITAPFTATRSLDAGVTAKFVVSGIAEQYLQVSVAAATGSTLAGYVKIIDGPTTLSSTAFSANGAATVTRALGNTHPHVIEVTGTANTPGAYTINVALLGGLQEEALTLPVDVNKSIPQYTSYRGNFTVTHATGLTIKSENLAFGGLLQVVDSTHAVLASFGGPALGDGQSVILPSAGAYAIIVSSNDGSAFNFHLAATDTPWAQAGTTLTATANGAMDPAAVIRAPSGEVVLATYHAENAVRSVELQKLSGNAWQTIAAPLPIEGSGTIGLGFDSTGAPVIADTQATGEAGNSILKVRVSRYTGSAWAAFAAGQDYLPFAADAGSGQFGSITVRSLPNDQPVIASSVDGRFFVHTFNGTTWVGLGPSDGLISSSAGDGTGSYPRNTLEVDGAGKPVIVYAQGGASVVARYDGTGWVGLGTIGGSTFSGALTTPQLMFDSGGNLQVVGIGNDTASSQSQAWLFTSAGTGTWTSTGPAAPLSGGSANGIISAVSHDGKPAAIWNAYDGSGGHLVSQTYSGSAWTGVGSTSGELEDYPQGAARAYIVQASDGLYIALSVAPTVLPRTTKLLKLVL